MQTVERFIHPRTPSHLWLLAAAGADQRLQSAAALAAAVVVLELNIADPVIGSAIALVILDITWESWHTVRNAEIDLEHIDETHDHHQHEHE